MLPTYLFIYLFYPFFDSTFSVAVCFYKLFYKLFSWTILDLQDLFRSPLVMAQECLQQKQELTENIYTVISTVLVNFANSFISPQTKGSTKRSWNVKKPIPDCMRNMTKESYFSLCDILLAHVNFLWYSVTFTRRCWHWYAFLVCFSCSLFFFFVFLAFFLLLLPLFFFAAWLVIIIHLSTVTTLSSLGSQWIWSLSQEHWMHWLGSTMHTHSHTYSHLGQFWVTNPRTSRFLRFRYIRFMSKV